MPIVAQLMNIPKEKITDRWAKIYDGFLDEAHQHEVSDLGEELIPVAEKCYLLYLNGIPSQFKVLFYC